MLTDDFFSVSIIGQTAYGSVNPYLHETDIIDSSSCVLQLEKLSSFNYKNHYGIKPSKVFINDCYINNVYNRGNINWEIFNSTIGTDSTVGKMSSYDGFCTYVYFTDTTWKFQSKAMANCIYNNGRTDSLIFIIQNEDMSILYNTYYDRYTFTAHNDTMTFEEGILRVGDLTQLNPPNIYTFINKKDNVSEGKDEWQSVIFDMPEDTKSTKYIDYGSGHYVEDIIVKKNCFMRINAIIPFSGENSNEVYMRLNVNGNTPSGFQCVERNSLNGAMHIEGVLELSQGDLLRLEYYSSSNIIFSSPDIFGNSWSAILTMEILE